MNTNAILIVVVILSVISVVLTLRMHSKMKKSSGKAVKASSCSNKTTVVNTTQKESDKKLSDHIAKHLSDDNHKDLHVHLHKIHPDVKAKLHEFYNDTSEEQVKNHKPVTEIMSHLSKVFRKNKHKIVSGSLINDQKNNNYDNFDNLDKEDFSACSAERSAFRWAVQQMMSKINSMGCGGLVAAIEGAICTAACEYGVGEVIDTAITFAADWVCKKLAARAETPLVNWLASKVGC